MTPKSSTQNIGPARSQVKRKHYAALNLAEALRAGDTKSSLAVLKIKSAPKPFEIDFDGIETLDDVWDIENKIHNAVFAGSISLAMAELALARVEGIGHTISENKRIAAANAAYEKKTRSGA